MVQTTVSRQQKKQLREGSSLPRSSHYSSCGVEPRFIVRQDFQIHFIFEQINSTIRTKHFTTQTNTISNFDKYKTLSHFSTRFWQLFLPATGRVTKNSFSNQLCSPPKTQTTTNADKYSYYSRMVKIQIMKYAKLVWEK